MKNIFFVSDTHFGHANCLKFKRQDGSPLRVFESVEEMDETMITRWNSVVGPHDRVYHCGDVVIKKEFLQKVLPRLNGKKVLLMGNHDIYGHSEYLKYFEDIRAYKVMPEHNLIASHIPVYCDMLNGSITHNIHGHLHANRVLRENKVDKQYINVSVECINYTPITLDEILSIKNVQ
jgi:calcineurin-like phosphoesterase family protein